MSSAIGPYHHIWIEIIAFATACGFGWGVSMDIGLCPMIEGIPDAGDYPEQCKICSWGSHPLYSDSIYVPFVYVYVLGGF